MKSRDIIVNRGNSARMYCNTLVFIAPDKRQLEHLYIAQREKIAWKEIVRETKRLDLTQSQSATLPN